MSEDAEPSNVMPEQVKPEKDRVRKKAEIEALLFATNGLTVHEICKRTGFQKAEVTEILEELELEHTKDSRGIQVVQEGDIWKMSIRPDITPNLKDLLPAELPSALVKTLAIIAANKPVKQSLIVRVRGNKAYEHIKKLEKIGFITAERKGLTNILDLTEKFFAYFNVPKEILERAIKQEVGDQKLEEEKTEKIQEVIIETVGAPQDAADTAQEAEDENTGKTKE